MSFQNTEKHLKNMSKNVFDTSLSGGDTKTVQEESELATLWWIVMDYSLFFGEHTTPPPSVEVL